MDFWHLACNMFCLVSFGRIAYVGSYNFLFSIIIPQSNECRTLWDVNNSMPFIYLLDSSPRTSPISPSLSKERWGSALWVLRVRFLRSWHLPRENIQISKCPLSFFPSSPSLHVCRLLLFKMKMVMCVETGLIGLVIFDLIGLVVGRTIFDHGSHLGGAGFGYFYGPIRVSGGIVK